MRCLQLHLCLSREGNAKMLVGGLCDAAAPGRPGQETDMVRGALVNYAMSDRDIRKAGLMYIMRSGRISYLVVADAPKEKQSSVFAGILAALKPHLGAVKTVDFSLLSEAPFAKDYFKKQGWDYLA